MKQNKWHVVEPEDRERIRCSDCDGPAFVCEHAEWNTGNTKGISFFYYCLVDAAKRGYVAATVKRRK